MMSGTVILLFLFTRLLFLISEQSKSSSLNSKPFSVEEARALPIKFSNMTTDIEERIRAEINKSKHRTLSYEEIGDRRVFVIGDVHGCLEELNDLLKTADVDTKNDVIISVGDILNKVGKLKKYFLVKLILHVHEANMNCHLNNSQSFNMLQLILHIKCSNACNFK